VFANLCSTSNVPGCLRRELPFTIFGPNAEIPYSYQGSIGMQQQLGAAASVEADYVFTGERAAAWNATGHNINLSYNPATGTNYPFSDLSRRPYPEWGRVDNWIQQGARSNYHALSLAFVRRMRGNWHEYRGVKVMPTFHPAYLLRNPGSKRDVWEDMKKVRGILQGDE
jgi:hypothetical protein